TSADGLSPSSTRSRFLRLRCAYSGKAHRLLGSRPIHHHLRDPSQPCKLSECADSPAQSSSSASANEIAAPASFILFDVSRVMRAPMLVFGTVCTLSKFAAHMLGNPSASVQITSVGMLRMVDVIGAMVTEFNIPIAESRVRISTGLRLSGALNVYQQ